MANVNSLHRQGQSAGSMFDAFDTIDGYLNETFQISLERVLVDASVYRMALELVGTVEIVCQEAGCFQCSDGGKIYLYEGAIMVCSAAYQYRVWIYEDHGGTRSMTDLREFAAFDRRSRSSVLHRGLDRLMFLSPSLYSDKKLH